jgi:exopolyphosphatase / guanosine-5'-triphosphate,3'-diphosphate pyrophosphatase
MVADLTMATLDIESLEICPWALREGIVLRHLESIAQEAPFSLQPVRRTSDGNAAVMQLRSGG